MSKYIWKYLCCAWYSRNWITKLIFTFCQKRSVLIDKIEMGNRRRKSIASPKVGGTEDHRNDDKLRKRENVWKGLTRKTKKRLNRRRNDYKRWNLLVCVVDLTIRLSPLRVCFPSFIQASLTYQTNLNTIRYNMKPTYHGTRFSTTQKEKSDRYRVRAVGSILHFVDT